MKNNKFQDEIYLKNFWDKIFPKYMNDNVFKK